MMKRIPLVLGAAVLLLTPFSAVRAQKHVRQGPIHVSSHSTRNHDLASKGPITVDGVVNSDVTSLGSSVTVRGEVNGDVVSLGGGVRVSGKVSGDVVALGGPIELSGTITKDVVALGGELIMTSSGAILGDVAVLGGKFHKPEGAVIQGDVAHLHPDLVSMVPGLISKFTKYDYDFDPDTLKERYVHKHRPKTLGQKLGGYVLFVFVLFGLGAIVMLMTMLVTKPVENVAEAIKGDLWRSAGAGFLVAVAFVPLLLFLSISIIGIPIIPLLFLLLFVAGLMGISAFSLVLSGRVFDSLKRPAPASPVAAGVGFMVLNLLFIVGKLLTCTGGLLSMLGMVFILTNLILLASGTLLGLGAVLMTRMGTEKHVPGRWMPAPKPEVPRTPEPPKE